MLTTDTPFARYQPLAGSYDEFRDRHGRIRPSWQGIADHLDRMDVSGVAARTAEARRLVRASSANFQLPRENGDQVRPWHLAIVPLVFDEPSWLKLESGLAQRVRVLEWVLNDLLGQQRLLKERVLPPQLLSANPFFLRAYHDFPVKDSAVTRQNLNLTATDLARDNDGTWWVTGDRTRAPSGLGFALENRVITSRILPQLIRQSNVTRLASFFSALQQHFSSIATRSRENPRIAILTPGEESYRYVEDAYLAGYLGYTLVQGRDLAIRGNRVFLKTLGGLLPIDVLWRHISDDHCDPLELDPSATQGATGMLGAIRAGNVAVANSIGSVLAQMPALSPFLNHASRFFFGEDLVLPSVATYWCGSAQERQYVLDNLDDLVLRDAFVVSGDPPVVPNQLTRAERDTWVAKIKAQPHRYVGQSRPKRSTTPVWQDGCLQSWHVALRSFQVQTADGVKVLPGGLSRVSPDVEALDHSPRSGRLGQDCWVLSSSPVDHEMTLLPSPDATLSLTRSGAELPSRVAENLFWLGRYAERSESIARLLRTTMVRITSESYLTSVSYLGDLPDLPRLTAALAAVGQIEPDHAIEEFTETVPDLELILPDSIFDRQQPCGLTASVIQMVDKAVAVRDRLSMDAYRIITRIGDDLTAPRVDKGPDLTGMIERVNRLITDLLAFAGLTTESMTRTHGWRFLQLGRRIERGYQTAELLAATLTRPLVNESSLLESVLRATDSMMTYRSRYMLQLQAAAVIDLLITDDTNPRSLAYQAEQITTLISQLPTDPNEFSLGQDQRLAEAVTHRIRMSQPMVLAHMDGSGSREQLLSLLQYLFEALANLSNAVAARYLIHAGVTQSLTGRVDDIRREPSEANPTGSDSVS